MNCWNYRDEALELKTYKDLRLAYPKYRAIAKLIMRLILWMATKVFQPRKWKVTFYDLVLSLLPAVLALHVKLSFENLKPNFEWCRFYEMWSREEAERTWLITFVLYVLLLAVVLVLKLIAEKYTSCKYGNKGSKVITVLGILALAALSFSSAVLDRFTPFNEFLSAIGVAIFIALISQIVLPLPKKYRRDAEEL